MRSFRLITKRAIIFNRTRTFFTFFNKYGSNKGYSRTGNGKTLKNHKETFINRNGKVYNINKTYNVYGPSLAEQTGYNFIFSL